MLLFLYKVLFPATENDPKQVVGQYKMWNEVKFWFTQMTFYNNFICIPLIIRQANHVEENPGPTIFEVLTRQEQFMLTTIKEMKFSLVLVSNV